MAQMIAVATVAKQLGINRRELQKMIQDGDLQTHEGMVDLEILFTCYPQLRNGNTGLCERSQLIRKTAFGRRVRERVGGEQEDVASLELKLHKKTLEYDLAKEELEQHRQLFNELLGLLGKMQHEGDRTQRETIRTINLWLGDRLK